MNRGRCLCGVVQYEAGPFQSMVHCHCSMCRRHHGALFATFLTARRTDFRWVSGECGIETYRSSERGVRPFCRRCGSVAPSLLPGWDVVFVPAGNVEGDPGIRPTLHMFAASAPDWFPISDGLPRHAAFPPEFGEGRAVENTFPEAKPDIVAGRCLCGDVTYELEGAPEIVQNCHCSRCRSARSAAHATNAFFRRRKLTWLSGEHRVESFALPEARRFGQAFCRRCGGKVPRAPGDYAVVPCGGLDASPGRPPRGHIFISSKAPWVEVTDGLPQWEELPPQH